MPGTTFQREFAQGSYASGITLSNGNTVEQELGTTQRQSNLTTDLAASGPSGATGTQALLVARAKADTPLVKDTGAPIADLVDETTYHNTDLDAAVVAKRPIRLGRGGRKLSALHTVTSYVDVLGEGRLASIIRPQGAGPIFTLDDVAIGYANFNTFRDFGFYDGSFTGTLFKITSAGYPKFENIVAIIGLGIGIDVRKCVGLQMSGCDLAGMAKGISFQLGADYATANQFQRCRLAICTTVFHFESGPTSQLFFDLGIIEDFTNLFGGNTGTVDKAYFRGTWLEVVGTSHIDTTRVLTSCVFDSCLFAGQFVWTSVNPIEFRDCYAGDGSATGTQKITVPARGRIGMSKSIFDGTSGEHLSFTSAGAVEGTHCRSLDELGKLHIDASPPRSNLVTTDIGDFSAGTATVTKTQTDPWNGTGAVKISGTPGAARYDAFGGYTAGTWYVDYFAFKLSVAGAMFEFYQTDGGANSYHCQIVAQDTEWHYVGVLSPAPGTVVYKFFTVPDSGFVTLFRHNNYPQSKGFGPLLAAGATQANAFKFDRGTIT